jgi:ABC-type antimicrobial peptide transport system permease subunit
MPLASPTTLVPITPQAALQSLALTVCVGLIAALLPAFRAATIHPVEALRTK